jgi:hypothetical protein
MLMMNDTFQRTWGDRGGPRPGADYWPTVIPAVRSAFPDFTFIAEAYWDLEWTLQQQGFDYCYDKRLYDRLRGRYARPVREHLSADLAYQNRLCRFLENHDEERVAEAFPLPVQLHATRFLKLSLSGQPESSHISHAPSRKCASLTESSKIL